MMHFIGIFQKLWLLQSKYSLHVSFFLRLSWANLWVNGPPPAVVQFPSSAEVSTKNFVRKRKCGLWFGVHSWLVFNPYTIAKGEI